MSRPMDPISAKHTHSFTNASFTVDARYTPTKIIGTGAYGVVCAARDNLAKKDVAIKKIKHSFQIATIAKRTLREIKLLRHFDRHENVISIKTILQPPPQPEEFNDIYIIMDLKETDLHRIIHSEQPLSEEHARYFLYQTLRGLKYIHSANVLHRDIKPSNLLINSNCALKICDFGMARGMASTPEEHAGFMTAYVATRWYRAPEVMLSFREYTYAIDMWSVGCVFAEMLGRKYLFPGQNYVHQLNLILHVLGTPGKELMSSIGNERVRKYLSSLDPSKKIPLEKVFPKARCLADITYSAEALSLLDNLLQFDPSKRADVEQTLQHPFLARYHNPAEEPTCAPFTFDFDEEQLSMAELKTLILREVQAYHTPANYNDTCVHCISGVGHTHVSPTGQQVVIPPSPTPTFTTVSSGASSQPAASTPSQTVPPAPSPDTKRANETQPSHSAKRARTTAPRQHVSFAPTPHTSSTSPIASSSSRSPLMSQLPGPSAAFPGGSPTSVLLGGARIPQRGMPITGVAPMQTTPAVSEIDFTKTPFSASIIAPPLPALQTKVVPAKRSQQSAQAISDIAAELQGLASVPAPENLDQDLERGLAGPLAFAEDLGHL